LADFGPAVAGSFWWSDQVWKFEPAHQG